MLRPPKLDNNQTMLRRMKYHLKSVDNALIPSTILYYQILPKPFWLQIENIQSNLGLVTVWSRP